MKKISQHPSILYANDLEQICQPLKSLGIEYFSHVMIDKSGRFSAIGMNPEFVQHYYEKQYYNLDIHRLYPNHEGYIFWDMVECDPHLNNLYEDFKCFSLGHSFTIVRHDIDGSKHYYDFSAALGNHKINHTYLQSMDFLKNFILYFTDNINSHSQLKKGYDFKSNIKKQSNDIEQTVSPFPLSTNRIYFTHNKYLTKREFECLHWLADGKTIDAIAMILGITQRTVKAHIVSIKQKLNCKSLFQLGAIYQKHRDVHGL